MMDVLYGFLSFFKVLDLSVIREICLPTKLTCEFSCKAELLLSHARRVPRSHLVKPQAAPLIRVSTP